MHHLRSARTVALVLLVSFFIAAPVRADIAPLWTDSELAGFAHAVVTGRVAHITTGWDGDTIYTYVTVDVADVLKGDVPDRQIVIKQLGGRVDDVALIVGGQAVFTVGEEILAFLEVRPRDRSVSVTGLWQGKWTLRADRVSGQRIATRAIPGAADRGAFGLAADARPLDAFAAQIRAAGSSAGRRAGDSSVNFHPRDAANATPLPPVDAAAIFIPSWMRERQSGEPIRLEIQRSGQDGLAGGGFAEVLRAAQSVAQQGSLTVEETRAASVPCFTSFARDGRVVVSFGDPCGEMSRDGATIAISGTWVNASTRGSRSGGAFMQVLQAGTITSGGAAAAPFLARSACFERIEAHELAGALGVVDPRGPSPLLDRSCGEALFQMAPSFTSGGQRATARDTVPPQSATIQTTRISVATDGSQAGRESRTPSISADGRYISFVSYATNLTNDSRAAAPNVFYHDNASGQTVFVAAQADNARITADGKYIIYRPSSGVLTTLSAYERSTTTVTTITTPSASDGAIYAISDDLRFVAYQRASPGPSTVILDRQASTTVVVSSTTYVTALALSYDGRYAAFTIGSSQFLFDQQTGLTSGLAFGNYTPVAFSQDGRYLTTTAGVYDITGAKYVLSGFNAAISPNGRFVSYNQTATPSDVFVYDQQLAGTARASVGSGGTLANAGSGSSSVNNVGEVAYSSSATNLVAGDTNGFDDIFFTVGAVPSAGAPGAPTGLTAQITTTGSSSSVLFTWTAPSTGSPATSYIIEAGSGPGLTDQANFSTGSTSTSFTAILLGSGTFYVRVRAVNASGTSPASNEVTVTAGTTLAVPGPPSSLQVAVTGSTVSLSWSAPTTGGAPTTYIIQASSSPGGRPEPGELLDGIDGDDVLDDRRRGGDVLRARGGGERCRHRDGVQRSDADRPRIAVVQRGARCADDYRFPGYGFDGDDRVVREQRSADVLSGGSGIVVRTGQPGKLRHREYRHQPDGDWRRRGHLLRAHSREEPVRTGQRVERGLHRRAVMETPAGYLSMHSV